MHFGDAIIFLISSALVGGKVHKLGKDSIRKSLKVEGGGSILEDIFLPKFFTMVLIIAVSIVVFCTYFDFFVFVEIISLITFQVFSTSFLQFSNFDLFRDRC